MEVIAEGPMDSETPLDSGPGETDQPSGLVWADELEYGTTSDLPDDSFYSGAPGPLLESLADYDGRPDWAVPPAEEDYRVRIRLDSHDGVNVSIQSVAELEEMERRMQLALRFLEETWQAEEGVDADELEAALEDAGRLGPAPDQPPEASTSGRPPLPPGTGSPFRASQTSTSSKLVQKVRSTRKMAADVDAALVKQQVAAASAALRQKSDTLRDLEDRLQVQQGVTRSIEDKLDSLKVDLGVLRSSSVPPKDKVRALQRRIADTEGQMKDSLDREAQAKEQLFQAGLAVRDAESDLARLQLESEALEPMAVKAKQERDLMMEATRNKEQAGANLIVGRRMQELHEIHDHLMHEEERRHNEAEAAREGRRDAVRRLKEQHDKLKAQALDLDQDQRVQVLARAKVVLDLRRNILAAQEELRRRNAARARGFAEKKKQHQAEFEALLQDGRNPYAVFRERDLAARADRRRRDLAERIRASEMEIAARLLKEEDKYKRRGKIRERELVYKDKFQKEMGNLAREERLRKWMTEHTRDQVELLDPTSRRPWEPSSATDIPKWSFGLGTADYKTMVKVAQNPKLFDAKTINVMLPRRYVLAKKREEQEEAGEIPVEREKPSKVEDEDEDEGVRAPPVPSNDPAEMATLAEPEFRGNWESTKDVAQGPRRYEPKLSVWEKRKMAEAHERHKGSITHKQVVMGREFHGAAFEPSPKVVRFRDFEVGKSYSQTVVLTNISWTKCSLRLLELPVDVRNCLTVRYTPSGQLSAGMTTNMTVVFEPKVNQDVRTHIPMLASTGPLLVPVECTTKKAEIKLSVRELDFSSMGQPVTLGESSTRSVYILNNGALPVEFEIVPTLVNALDAGPRGTGHHGMDGEEEDEEEEGEEGKGSDGGNNENEEGEEGGDHRGSTAAAPLRVLADEEAAMWSRLDGAGFTLPDEHRRGTISGYSKRELKIGFTPQHLGQVGAVLRVRFVTKGGPRGTVIPDLELPLRAIGGDIPCILESDVIDLRCCMHGQSYAAELRVVNRGRAAMKATVVIPKHLSEYVQIAPETGFVQGSSSMSFRLTFRPHVGLLDRAGRRAERIDGSSTDFRLTMPLKVKVLDQALSLPCTLQATVTNNLLQVTPSVVDFGTIPVGEFASLTLTVRNMSRLPVKFGFQRSVKNGLVFKPNGGFASLLPGESREVEACFNPPTTGPHHLEIECRTLLGQSFKLPCRAVAYRPSLFFTCNRVVFRSTELGSTSTESIFLRNTSDHEQLFHFVVPKGCEDLMVTPQVGSLPPHSSIRVQMNFLPQLGEDTPSKEEWDPSVVPSSQPPASADGDFDEGEEAEEEAEDQAGGEGGRGGVAFDLPSRATTPDYPQQSVWCRRSEWLIPLYIKVKGLAEAQTPTADVKDGAASAAVSASPTRGTIDTAASQATLKRTQSLAASVTGGAEEEPAAGSPTQAPGKSADGAPPVQRIHLHAFTSAVLPRIVLHGKGVTWHPDRGYYQLHFGQIPLGQRVLMTVSMRNNTGDEHTIASSSFDPNGPFQLLNPFKTLEPFAGHKVLLEFKPKDEGPATDVLTLRTESSSVRLRVMGEGVSPDLEVDCAEVDCGDVLKGARVVQSFTVTNHGQFPIRMVLLLRSLVVREAHNPPKEDDGLPDFRCNLNGQSPFLVKPSEATLAPGANTTVEVAFCPDHQHAFEDLLDITVPNQPEKLTLKLWGRGWDRGLYILGFDRPVTVADPTMSAKLRVPVAIPVQSEAPRRVTLAPEKIEGGKTAQGVIVIGNIAGQGAAPGEYWFSEVPVWAKDRGWSIENPKATVAPGARQVVRFRFTAPSIPTPNSLAYYGMGEWVELPLTCTIKGGNPPQPTAAGTEIKFIIRVFVVASVDQKKL